MPARPLGLYWIDHIPVYARVADRDPPDADGWTAVIPVIDTQGRVAARVRRRADGSVHLPFDPNEAITNYLTEGYLDVGNGRRRQVARRAGLSAYYAFKPFVPRKAQLSLRRLVARSRAATAFPRWPVEPALHELYRWLMNILADVAGEPVPWIAPWPNGRDWALVLTHDVEGIHGYERIQLLRDLERSFELRSSWNLVPERYERNARYHVDGQTVDSLLKEGCEIGIHGLRHDGRDLASLRTLRRRLPRMQAAAKSWNAVGFRSPATHRVYEWMPMLGFEYDSSYPDTDPYEPQPGGSCSLLPYMNGNLVELPITLTQDHTLFSILGETDERMWVAKTDHIRREGGMALVLTHPDYADDPRLLSSYRALLERYHNDATVWHALPREVSSWWRRRSSSRIERENSRWVVVGPAAGEAAVAFASGTTDPANVGTEQ
jgi:hypothetical protein